MTPKRGDATKAYIIPARWSMHRCGKCGKAVFQVKAGDEVVDVDASKDPTDGQPGAGYEHVCPEE